MRAGRLILAALGIGLGAWGVVRAQADLHAEILALRADHFAETGQALRARDAAMRAVHLRPGDARHLEHLAQAEERLGRRRTAEAQWLEAARLRPSWPYAWAQHARLRLDAGNDAADASLRAVARTGDHERGLWEMFAKLALIHDQTPLSPLARQWLDERLRRELADHGDLVFGYAFSHRRETALCARFGQVLPDPPQYRHWCDEARHARQTCVTDPDPASPEGQWCAQVDALWRQLDYPSR